MTTRQILSVLLVSAMLTACGGGSPKSASQDNAKPQTPTEQPAVQQPAKNTLPFLTQDLRMYNMFGKVKNFKTTFTNTDAQQKPTEQPEEDWLLMEFDADGHFVNRVSYWAEKSNIKQQDGDKIIKTETPIEEYGGMPVIVEYKYDSDGLVKSMHIKGIESVSDIEYTYNADGELIKSIEKGSGEGSVFEIETTYTILERDTGKNWTKCFTKTTSMTGPDDGSGKLEPLFDGPTYQLQTRAINYW